MQRVLELIRNDVAEDKVHIDTRDSNLESYFLQVVQNARQAAAETSGATSGARVAAYLRGDGAQKNAADKILERLTAPELPVPPPAATPTHSDLVDKQKLEALTSPPRRRHPRAEPKAQPETPADLEQANESSRLCLEKRLTKCFVDAANVRTLQAPGQRIPGC